jgi:hypothetical protein
MDTFTIVTPLVASEAVPFIAAREVITVPFTGAVILVDGATSSNLKEEPVPGVSLFPAASPAIVLARYHFPEVKDGAL